MTSREVKAELRDMRFTPSEILKMMEGEIIDDVKVDTSEGDMVVKILDDYDDQIGADDNYEPGLIPDPEWEACMCEGQCGREEDER